jgi:hypothetical protein
MGAGKTSWAIQHINESMAYKKFIYITPFLKEIDRIKDQVTDREFYAPNNKNAAGRKLRSLKELIVSGMDICATHSLFEMADEELIELLTDSGYTLILDEVMEVIGKADISKVDIKLIIDGGLVEIKDDKRVVWKNYTYTNGSFDNIRILAETGNLYYHRGEFLVWAFPPHVFKAFDNVIVMTYLFDAQLQRNYFDMFNIEYEKKAVKKNGDKYELVEYIPSAENRKELMKLIDLYDGKLNEVGERYNALSSRWLGNANDEILDRIQKNIYNFFHNVCDTKADDNMWTTLKDFEARLCGKGYKSGFVSLTMRATNEYNKRKSLAYVFNRYMQPFQVGFFTDRGITVNQELLAVSDLLQWIWRSRIREGEPIKLYLPSRRMRELLQAWANYDI